MNLIGHYASTPVHSAEVRLGAVVPDLASVYRRKVRSLALMELWRADPQGARLAGLPALLAGVDFHHTVDKHFHRAPVFRELETALRDALLAASDAPGLKRFLPAHVLAEMYLDHLLLQERPGLAQAFYRDVAGGRELLIAFVSRHPQAEGDGFARFVDHVVGERFVDAYGTLEGILGRMNRILMRFGQRALDAAEQDAVARCLTERRDTTWSQLQAFLAAMAPLAPHPQVWQPVTERIEPRRGWAAPTPAPQGA